MADYRTWKINLWTLWGTQMIVNIAFGLVMPFVSYYMLEIDPTLTDAQLALYTGLSSTIPSASMAVASPIWGFVSDIYGRKMMLLRAMVCATIILFMFGFCHTITGFLTLRFFQGVFTGTLSPAMSLVSASSPQEKMSYSLGLMTSATFLGWSMGQMIATPIVAVTGFAGAFNVAGVMMLLGCFLTLVPKEIPGTYGKELYRERKEAKKKAKEENKGHKGGVLSATVLMLLAAVLILRMGRSMFAPFVALFVRETLGTMEGATLYTGIINAASCTATAIASITLTKLGDRYDKIKFSLVLVCVGTVFQLFMLPKFPLWLFVVFYSLLYFFAGAVEPVLTSAMSEITDASTRGTLFGLTSTVNCIAMMLSPMIASGVSVAYGTRGILFVMPVLLFIAIGLLIAIMVKFYSRPAYDDLA